MGLNWNWTEFCGKCHWYLDRDSSESLDCLGYHGTFNNISSPNAWTWYTFPFVCIILNFFHQCLTVFEYKSFTSLVIFILKYFIFSVAVINWEYKELHDKISKKSLTPIMWCVPFKKSVKALYENGTMEMSTQRSPKRPNAFQMEKSVQMPARKRWLEVL